MKPADFRFWHETDLRRLSAIWSLTGAKQTWQGKLVLVAIGTNRTGPAVQKTLFLHGQDP